MLVMKFGGTSVGSAERMKKVAELIRRASAGNSVLVVLSAMSGTTNTLLQIADYVRLGNPAAAVEELNRLEEKYRQTCTELGINYIVKSYFSAMRSECLQPYTPQTEKNIVANGELMSTAMMADYMQVPLLPALDYMRIDDNGEPDMAKTDRLLRQLMTPPGPLGKGEDRKGTVLITQGFICRNHNDEIDNLKRGGSDYSASIIGGLLEADEIQIWTDIDGIHNNDPRYVEGTRPVPQLSFAEAAELAYFGAKILHPTCILPAKMHNVPVRLLNTMDPSAPGTLINNDYKKGRIEAIAAKDGIAAVRVHSDRMLMAYGFLSRIFAIFEKYKTSIDLITTSEVAVSMSIDNLTHIGDILPELKALGTVSLETNLSIISVVGDLQSNNLGFEALVVEALHDIPVRMISYGGSDHNISILVNTENKVRALQALSKAIFV
ncbi:MAG: aspartate kinase [Paludibacteraceae bacterium]|nr:aspartate kinase [Paludibacteraceae bacterium]